MEERDAVAAQQRLVVAGLGAQIDHGAHAVLARQGGGGAVGEASADREARGDPVEVHALSR